MATIGLYFPGVPILPAIGNNDLQYHDRAPSSDQADQYYRDLWRVFFEEVPANGELALNPQIKESFLQGGYYAYQVNEGPLLLSLNGIYPFTKNNEQGGAD